MKKSEPTKEPQNLADSVRSALGAVMLKALCAQPLALANGGEAAILQRACKEAAGFPDPVAAGVAKFRVLCGSSAVPKPKPTPKEEA